MTDKLAAINKIIEKESAFVDKLLSQIHKAIVGQNYLVERLLIGVLSGGHILLEGVPGLAKTLSAKTLASSIHASFKRIQFTPDLLPSDLIGTLIYDQSAKDFTPKLGPIFANFILADEINRAPAKVQSALLEAMQEKQITIGKKTYTLEEPFIVLATQNPIEQEGTYPLPEAQVDRFFMKLKISYPTKEEEKTILNVYSENKPVEIEPVINLDELKKAQNAVAQIYVDEKIKEYVLDLVFATRNPEEYNLKNLKNLIDYGASPRASLYLLQAAKAHAFLQRRGYVTPEDIKAIGKDVLRHRIIPSFEAEAEEMTSETIIDRIFSEIIVP